MPFTRVRDLEMYYETGGSGPRLLYISGTGGDLRGQPRVFDGPLPQAFEVLAYDQRGLGQTSKPDQPPYTMADYADDAAALLDTVGWERCAVMGVSFGGMVAQELALRYPDRVERLVLCCTSSGGQGGASYPLHELQHLSIEERAVFQLSITDKRKDAAWQAANPDAVRQAVDMALAGQARRQSEPGGEMGYLRQLEARAGHDTFDRLPSLRVPTFLAGGRYDGQAEPANMETLLDRIPGSRLEFFEGGHGFTREDPNALRRIMAFLLGELNES
ncbi:MAG TPA: alpha/beta hydrolase [Dehalococcoidia bacterium]|nr:alpha/beta hydrolase [Dehalococcoidia bacterium]